MNRRELDRFKVAPPVPNKWRIYWHRFDDEDPSDGGWIATNGSMFMNPGALKELAPDVYDACVKELGHEPT